MQNAIFPVAKRFVFVASLVYAILVVSIAVIKQQREIMIVMMHLERVEKAAN